MILRYFLRIGWLCCICALLMAPEASAQASEKLSLDGELDYATASDSDALSVSGQALTLEVWIKHDGQSASDAIILDKTTGGASNGGYELRLEGSGEEVPVSFELPAAFNTLTSESGIPADRWTHVAAVYNGDEMSIYINGELDASGGAGGDIDGNSLPLKIGTNTSSSNEQFFSGQLDEVRIWSAARSLLEIRENRFGEIDGSAGDLEAYYPFGGGEPTADRAGDNHITLDGDASTGTPDAFPVPPDVYVENEGAGQVTLRWEERTGSDDQNAAGSFAIHRSPPTGTDGRSQLTEVSSSTTSYTATGLSNGKTYFWQVTSHRTEDEGAASDYSPLVTGTPHDGSEPAPMKGGAALSLDGDLDYGTVGDRPSLDVTGEEITLEAWIKHDGESDPDAVILDKTTGEASTNGYELRLEGSGEEVPVAFDLPNAFNTLISESGIPADRWTHVAAVYNGDAISIYINGELDARSGAGDNVGGNDLPLKIGTNTSASNDQFFSGAIDEVRIWSTARTEAEVEASFQQEVVGSEEGLRAYWRFNDAGKGVMQETAIGYTERHSDVVLEGDAAVEGPGVFPLPPRTYAVATDDTVDVAWSERSPGEAEQYELYRATGADGTGRSSLQTLASTDTSYTDGSPSNATNYFYEVTTINEQGQESDYAHDAPATPSTRPFGNALALDGDQDYGTVTDRPSLDVADQTITLETWIKHDGQSDPDAVILDKTTGGASNGGYELRLEGSGEEVPVSFDLPNTFNTLTSNSSIPQDTWTHVAVVYDGSEISLYIDGELDASTGAGDNVGSNDLPLKIGTNTSASNEQFFSGAIDEVRLWNTARTAAEIQANYEEELLGNEPDLRAYWRFNEVAGTNLSRAAAERPKTVAFSGDADFVEHPARQADENPVFITAPDTIEVVVEDSTTFQYEAEARADGASIESYSLTDAPAFVSFDTDQGRLIVEPTTGQVGVYEFSVTVSDTEGNSEATDVQLTVTDGTAAPGEVAELPRQFELEGNYPNPFNPTTTISYALPEPVHVRLTIYSVLGRRVATVVDERQTAGRKTVRFEADNLPSGVYIYRLSAGRFSDVRQMILAK